MQRAHRRSALRRQAGFAVAAIVGIGTLTPAYAQSAAEQWAAAIREQKEAIVSNRAARARCGSASDGRCAALVDRARLMEENLGRLERQHSRLVGGGPRTSVGSIATTERPVRSDRRVRSEAPPGLAERPVAPAQQRSIFSMLFGGGGTTQTMRSEVRIDGEPIDDGRSGVTDAGAGVAGGAHSGTYRTLCVRTCDGYFFPVSFNASRSRLKTDANVCKALCPQAETRLYYHDASGQEAEDAVAADDETPLAGMPNAFVYRTKRISDCSCGTPDPRTLPVQAGGLAGTRLAFAGGTAEIPLPRRRPSPDQDPATQAIEASGLSTEPVAPLTPMSEASAAKVAAAGEAVRGAPPKVRIVGPKWLSDR